MRTEVMYRDLPGGPLRLDFTDELPLSVFCSKCGMLSKNMFEDPLSHAFCSVCIFESSDRKKIHCKHENKQVSVDEMMPAVDIITIVMDQLVYCPNRGGDNSCNNYYSLKDLEGHYLECEQTKIFCLSCGSYVKGQEWGEHVKSCPQQILQCRYCVVAVPRCKLEAHERVCNENRWAIRGSAEETMKPRYVETQPKTVSQNQSRHSDQQNQNQQLRVPASKAASEQNTCDGVEITTCPSCSCKVKKKNVTKHMEICLRRKRAPPTNSILENGKEASQIEKKTEPIPTPAQVATALLGSHEMVQQFQQRSLSTTRFPDGRQIKPTVEPIATPAPASTAPPASNPQLDSFTSAPSRMSVSFSEKQIQPTTEPVTTPAPALTAPPPSNEQFHGFANSSSRIPALADGKQTRSQAYGTNVFPHSQTPSNNEASCPHYGSQAKTDTSGYESDFEIIHSVPALHDDIPGSAPAPSAISSAVDALAENFETLTLHDRHDGRPAHEQCPEARACELGNNMGEAGRTVVCNQPSSSSNALPEASGTVKTTSWSNGIRFISSPLSTFLCGIASAVAMHLQQLSFPPERDSDALRREENENLD